MPELRISIRLEGAALKDDPDAETVAILRSLADRIEENRPLAQGPFSSLRNAVSLFDHNGNRVGQVKVHED